MKVSFKLHNVRVCRLQGLGPFFVKTVTGKTVLYPPGRFFSPSFAVLDYGLSAAESFFPNTPMYAKENESHIHYLKNRSNLMANSFGK